MLIKYKNSYLESEKRSLCCKIIFFFLCTLFFSLSTNAQCAMCRASLESEGDATKVDALNDGIVYLMAFPYLIVGVVGIVVYRMYRKKKET
jgi:hypothetical protein